MSSQARPSPPNELPRPRPPAPAATAPKPAMRPTEDVFAQFRELLVGEIDRRTSDRIDHLDDMIREMDRKMTARMAEFDDRLTRIEARLERDRRRALSEMGAALSQASMQLQRQAQKGEEEA